MSQTNGRRLAVVLTICALHSLPVTANAQFGGSRIKRPIDRPTVSPYVNLFRRGNATNPILNYYGAVRPLQQQYQQNRTFSRQLGRVERRQRYSNRTLGEDAKDKKQSGRRSHRMLGATGHSTSFSIVGGPQGGLGGGEESDLGQSGNRFGDEEGAGGFSGHSAGFGTGVGGGFRDQ